MFTVKLIKKLYKGAHVNIMYDAGCSCTVKIFAWSVGKVVLLMLLLLLHGSNSAESPVEIVLRVEMHGVDLLTGGCNHHVFFDMLPVPPFRRKLDAIPGHILLLDVRIRPQMCSDAIGIVGMLRNQVHLDTLVEGDGAGPWFGLGAVAAVGPCLGGLPAGLGGLSSVVSFEFFLKCVLLALKDDGRNLVSVASNRLWIFLL